MCVKRRQAEAPFRRKDSMGVVYIEDAHGLAVAALCAPKEDDRGPLAVHEMKQWIADNAAMFTTAPRLLHYCRCELLMALSDGKDGDQVDNLVNLIAEATNTAPEFVIEQAEMALAAEEQRAMKAAA